VVKHALKGDKLTKTMLAGMIMLGVSAALTISALDR
jgi:hypothetical protein